MRLKSRLTKLEARRHHKVTGPRMIFLNAASQTENGGPKSIPASAIVQNLSGWKTITRIEGETETAFRARAQTLSELEIADVL